MKQAEAAIRGCLTSESAAQTARGGEIDINMHSVSASIDGQGNFTRTGRFDQNSSSVIFHSCIVNRV